MRTRAQCVSRKIRPWLLALVAGTMTIMPSCASPPTMPEITAQFDQEAELLKQARDQMIAACNGDAACIAAAKAWYTTIYTELLRLRWEAIQENWQDAYERRKEWEKKIREMFPSWPDLKDIIPKLGVLGTIDIESSALGSGSSGSVALTSPTWESTIKISGTVQFSGSLLATGEVSGSLSMSGNTASDGSRTAQVYSGMIVAKIIDTDDLVTLTLEKDSRNQLTIGADGVGTLNLVFTREISDKAWNAIVPYFIQVKVPVTRTSNDRIEVNLSGVKLSKITGRTPFAITDYNDDGVRDHTLDYASLLADYAMLDTRADMNTDGAWTQADLDMWENLHLADKNAE